MGLGDFSRCIGAWVWDFRSADVQISLEVFSHLRPLRIAPTKISTYLDIYIRSYVIFQMTSLAQFWATFRIFWHIHTTKTYKIDCTHLKINFTGFLPTHANVFCMLICFGWIFPSCPLICEKSWIFRSWDFWTYAHI